MTTAKISADEVFLNVRKAFRLLHDYQQMVIDAVRYIGSQLDIPEWGSEPAFAGDARKGYRYLEQKAWDWLPMMECCFHFMKDLPNGKFLSCTILIMSDTGFIEADERCRGVDDIDGFKHVEDAVTKVAFFLYGHNAYQFRIKLDDRSMMRGFLADGKGLPAGVFGRCYPMSQLLDPIGADSMISDILALAAAHQDQLPLIERAKKL